MGCFSGVLELSWSGELKCFEWGFLDLDIDEDESSIGITARERERLVREICERGNVVWIEGDRERESARRAWLDSRLNDPLLPAIFFFRVCLGSRSSESGR